MEEGHDSLAVSGDPAAKGEHTASGASGKLVLEGPVDLDAAAELRARAERLLEGTAGVEIDWHAATYACAGAIQVLLALEAALAARGRSLRVARDNPEIRRYLHFAGLSGHFPIMERGA